MYPHCLIQLQQSVGYGIPKQTKLSDTLKTIVNRFSSKTIVKCVENNCQNFVDETVVELVRNQLSNSGTFHYHSNAHCQLVQKNCQIQEFTMPNTFKFIMVKHTSPPCSKHLNAPEYSANNINVCTICKCYVHAHVSTKF